MNVIGQRCIRSDDRLVCLEGWRLHARQEKKRVTIFYAEPKRAKPNAPAPDGVIWLFNSYVLELGVALEAPDPVEWIKIS